MTKKPIYSRISLLTASMIAALLFTPPQLQADSVMDPVSFERIWLQHNQQNLIKRYQYYSEQVRQSQDSLYLIGFDAAPDRKIDTSDGVKDAIISRMHIHYQSDRWLFLVDWLSAIPQPQVYEGYTYGDMVIGRTWPDHDRDGDMTLGLRHSSTPRSTLVDERPVFNYVSSASESDYSLFVHYRTGEYNFGTFFGEKDGIKSLTLTLPDIERGGHTFEPTLTYFAKNAQVGLQRRLEVSADHRYRASTHHVRTSAALALLPDSDELAFANAFINLAMSSSSLFSQVVSLHYFNDIEADENFIGVKLSLLYGEANDKGVKFNLSIHQNAFGDFTALVVRDEPVLSFTLTSRLESFF